MRRRTALLVGGVTAAALALGGLVGGVLAESRSASRLIPPGTPAIFSEQVVAGLGGGIGATPLARLEASARERPRDSVLLTRLGFAYQLRWRETSDPSYLPRSEKALRRAIEFGTDDADAILGLGSLALIQHDFRAAHRYGRTAERLLPGSFRPYGVLGDALVELGRYDDAFAAFEQMISLRPGLASYARIAYARELVGDRDGARQAMELALESAAGQPEPTAWAHVELAKLELGSGHVSAGRRHALAALAALPGYPSARVELARVEAAAGNLRVALRQAKRAVDANPTGAAVGLLGDLFERVGQPLQAQRQRATVAVIDRLLAVNGVAVDLESALYRADQGIRPAETVALARRARADRPSIYGDDTLGWALARAGRCEEALPFARRSLRLGTQDALLFFHRGYAEGCAGDRAAMRAWYAKALDLNPAFSVRWAPVAEAALGNS